ncbi:hypothetical protein [Chitinivibrio alkaliphilus]|uniref:Uncharacterized protein n=1 Tax=Chitinivibrio alkaliphilus ACht1 TaxID=1313304 RepID=U7D5B6_9BACT|nr:hypothetical protein [Chitinivibrio alkaliphilus]ERP31714.1 hypothetical protein CALK_1376 [Chitinivibrio alkaliphilus ACht1]
MNLDEREQALIAEALSLYTQFAAQQMPPQAVEELSAMVQEITEKLPHLGQTTTGEKNIPPGITEEWFDAVCVDCESYSPAKGCSEPVTKKFPGKCDPILHYEMAKK